MDHDDDQANAQDSAAGVAPVPAPGPAPDDVPPGADVLSSDDGRLGMTVATAGRAGFGTGRRAAVGAAAVAALLVAGGGAYAWAQLSGGGPQPESHVPASALAFAKIDLDPAADQKIAVLRFRSAFPKSTVDPKGKASLKDQLLKDAFAGQDNGLDYGRDIKPWLGDRVGIAAVPVAATSPDDLPVAPLAVVQYTDQAQAKAALDRALERERKTAREDAGPDVLSVGADGSNPDGTDFGYVLKDGYALISDTVAHARQFSQDAARASLSDGGTTYDKDVATLDGNQVAVGWVDIGATTKLFIEAAKRADSGFVLPDGLWGTATGRLVAGVHVSPRFVEVQGRTLAADPTGVGTGGGQDLVQGLPAGTMAALSVTRLGPAVGKAFSGLKAMVSARDLADAEQQTGLTLPGDLLTLLGSQDVLAFGGMGQGGEDLPKVALRAVTGDRPGAVRVADKLVRAGHDSGVPLTSDDTPDGLVLATSPGYGRQVAAGHGTLGASPRFQEALPDAAGAGEVGYVDAAAFYDTFLKDLATPDDGAEPGWAPLGAVGASASQDGGDGRFRVRVTLR